MHQSEFIHNNHLATSQNTIEVIAPAALLTHVQELVTNGAKDIQEVITAMNCSQRLQTEAVIARVDSVLNATIVCNWRL